jgi:NADH dehydrogenase [ubiquinone] 1 alpha subcomplex assembly factor 7
MSLLERLKAEIAQDGPISVASYMFRCLHDPLDGYYATRPALGERGDFITAPLVSQMFGELLGLWAAEMWAAMGSPSRVRLVELGPGDGTMMSDILRAARAVPDFQAAIEVWLVDQSDPLRAAQAETLQDHDIRWAAGLEDLPTDLPLIILANEFLDCLPVNQFVKTGGGWKERRVGLDDGGALAFGLAPGPAFHMAGDQPLGWVLSRSGALADAALAVSRLIATTPCAALFIDYGSLADGFGDTLQALRGHAKEDPLAHPGEADLTVRVDFSAFIDKAVADGAAAQPLVTQAAFLRALGVEARAAALADRNPDRAARVGRQLERLIGEDQMGELFKVCCLHSPGLQPPGFGAAP